MAELNLENWLPMSPMEGPPLPRFLGITWPWYTPPGAEFKVSDLVISPTEVNPGQVVAISCAVTNTGAEAGSYTVKLGGDFVAQQSVILAPGASETVGFEVTPTVAKTYQVSVDGLTGSFKAITAPAFDPWVYDVSGDGYISKAEAATATVDYFDGKITKDQALQVVYLYESNIYRWA